MKTLHIDSYKVHAVDSNHIMHVGGWHILAPKDWGLYLVNVYQLLWISCYLYFTLFYFLFHLSYNR